LVEALVQHLADHGEALGEQHQLDHQVTVIEEVLRVPLIVLADDRPDVPTALDSVRQIPELLAAHAGVDADPWRVRRRVPDGVAVAELRVRRVREPGERLPDHIQTCR